MSVCCVARRALGLALVVIFVACESPAVWEGVSPADSRVFPQAVSTGGRVWILGGAGATGLMNRVDTFDGVDVRTAPTPLRVPRQAHAAVALGDGRIALAGGANEQGPVGLVEIYAPDGRSTVFEAGGGVGTGLVPLASDRLLIAGGGKSAVQLLDLAQGEVTDVADVPYELTASAHLLAFDSDHVLFVGAGAIAIFDTVSWSFSSVTSLGDKNWTRPPTAVRLADGNALLTGGCCSSSGDALDDAWLVSLDGAVDRLPPLRSPRFAHTSTLLLDGRVLITGGSPGVTEGGPFGAQREVEFFEPGRQAFVEGPPLIVPRAGHAGAMLSNGTVVVVGSVDYGSAELPGIETYRP